MYEQRLPIEEWKAKKQAELKETIAAQKSALQEVVQDGQRLADYLYGRGRLGSHITSGNAALVLQTLPQARAVLTARDWDKFGRRVNKGAKGIPKLVRVNGYYNVGSICRFDFRCVHDLRQQTVSHPRNQAGTDGQGHQGTGAPFSGQHHFSK